MESEKSEFASLPSISEYRSHQFPVNLGARANSGLIKYRASCFSTAPLHSYIIRNAKKWCRSKMAIPEDAAITAYVVSPFNISSAIHFSGQVPTLRIFPTLPS